MAGYKRLRNMLIHEYFGVDLDIIWKVVEEDLPVLMKTVKKIMEEEGK